MHNFYVKLLALYINLNKRSLKNAGTACAPIVQIERIIAFPLQLILNFICSFNAASSAAPQFPLCWRMLKVF
jgi:hypothetical protein